MEVLLGVIWLDLNNCLGFNMRLDWRGIRLEVEVIVVNFGKR